MRFSTKTTYGIRALARLAAADKDANLSLAKIAKDEKISLKYLEALFSKLKRQGLVTAEKGTAGGYRLAKLAGRTNLLDVVQALEGTTAPFYCLSDQNKVICSGRNSCAATKVLGRVQKAVDETLKSINLEELV